MTSAVIDLSNVSFSRNGNRILSDISFTVQAGEHWALLGPNGAGKSTMLGFCGARTHPTAGVVEILGERLGRVDMQELRRGIGHVDPRHPVRSPLSVVDVVLTGLTGTIELPMRGSPPRMRQHVLGHSSTRSASRHAPTHCGQRSLRGNVAARSLLAPWSHSRSCFFSTSRQQDSTWLRASSFSRPSTISLSLPQTSRRFSSPTTSRSFPYRRHMLSSLPREPVSRRGSPTTSSHQRRSRTHSRTRSAWARMTGGGAPEPCAARSIRMLQQH